MSIPFNIALPKFNIDNKSRDISITFSTFGKMDVPQVTTVIDYWSITDHRGRFIKEEPSIDNRYILVGKHGKKISLIMQGAGFKLAYDCLDICIHFLTQNGQSIAAHYTYKAIGNRFSFTKIEETAMTDEDKDTMFDILIKAAEYEKKKPCEKAPSNGNQNQRNGDGFENGYTPEITDYLKAIEREMRFLKGNGGRRYKITNGQFVMQSQGGYVYSFDLEAELYLAEDSPVTVTVGLDSIPGVVLVCENFQVIIALEKIPYADKSLKIPKAEISAEPWKLLEKLNIRLRRINETNIIALSLLSDGPRLATAGALSSIARGQETAYNHALNSPITVIWGPPGTGKTYTMANISAEFLRQGKSVLIVSHSNVSVDNVAKQIYSQIKDSPLSALLQKSKILRYGYVRDEELQKNDYITSFKVVIKNSSDKAEFDRLQDEYKKLTAEAEISADTNGNVELQTRYYDYMQRMGFVEGNAGNKPKDAREKTSGLVDIGLIDDGRHLTNAGISLLEICNANDFSSDNFFEIPKDSYIYLKQLLKTSSSIDGQIVRPFVVLLYVLSRVEELSMEEFTYLLPLCTNYDNTQDVIDAIQQIRANELCIDEYILERLMEMDNYQRALQFLLETPVDEDVIRIIGMNRNNILIGQVLISSIRFLICFLIILGHFCFCKVIRLSFSK